MLLVGEECLPAIVEIESELPMDPGARFWWSRDRGDATLPSWARPFDDRDDALPDGVLEAQAAVLQKDPCFYVFTSAPRAFRRPPCCRTNGVLRACKVLGWSA